MDAAPQAIGRYRVVGTIGRGAMGVVYRGQDPLIGREVALKTITASGLLSPEQMAEFKARFFREAQAAGVLHHPNIVTVHDVGEQDGVPFMAMELVEGTSLSRLIKERGRLPAPQAVKVVRQVAEGLAFAHAKGVVHRDIKPDNILVETGTGRAVIADFGIAHISASELTRTGEVLGTPFFMSPEQVLSNPLDGRSDLFSLGVVFYLALTGNRPFRGETISSVCYHIVHAEPAPLPPDAAIPANLAPVLGRLLAKDPAQRYPDGASLIAALDAAVGAASTGAMAAAGASLSPESTLDLSASPVAGVPFTASQTGSRLTAPGGAPPSATRSGAVLAAASAPPAAPGGTGARTVARTASATQAGARTGGGIQPLPSPEEERRNRRLLIGGLALIGLLAVLAAFLFGALVARRAAARRALQQQPAATKPADTSPGERPRRRPPGKAKKTAVEAPPRGGSGWRV